MKHHILLAAGIIAALSSAVCLSAKPAATASRPAAVAKAKPKPGGKYFNPDPAKFMFENKLRPGMIGYGLTVMRGAKIQKFKVKIIDVIKDFSVDMNVILVRCSGLGLKKSGIIEGMSGSPVFIDGKLIGAIAYGWPYSKSPIGGVQPIRQMLQIPLPGKTHSPRAGAGGAISWLLRDANRADAPGWRRLIAKTYSGVMWRADARSRLPSHHANGLQTLATPLMVSTANRAVLRFIRGGVAGSGLTAVAAGGAGVTSNIGGQALLAPGALDLRPGAAISVPLLSGDMDMCAIGTVTAVIDKRVYAFGHRFYAQGPTHFPIAGAYIYHILPLVTSSFKLGDAAGPIQGSLLMDQETGIMGVLGPKPVPVPITVSVSYHHPAWHKVFHYQLYPNRNTTLESIGGAILGSMDAKRNLTKKNGKYTVHIRGDIRFSHFALPVDYQATTGNFSPLNVLLPIALLNDNPFHDLKLKSLHFSISSRATSHAVALISAGVKRRVVQPGGTIVIKARLKPDQKPGFTAIIRLAIPASTPDGTYNLQVASATNLLLENSQTFPQFFAPQNIAALKKSVRYITSFSANRIYAQLVLNTHGLTIGSTSLPNLPASRISILSQNPPEMVYPLPDFVGTSVPLSGVLSTGEMDIPITVKRHPFGRFAGPVKAQLPPNMNFPQ